MPIIRLASKNDAATIQAIYAPFCENSPATFETKAPTLEEMNHRISKIMQKYPWLVYESNQEVVGYVYAAPHHERTAYQWSVNVSVYIHEKARRQGIGRALYTSLFELLKIQGFYNAYAGITQPNQASMNLHRSLGFQEVGIYRNVGYKCGNWHDVIWLELPLQEPRENPQIPIAIREIPSDRILQRTITKNTGLRDRL
ncbi:arsinothricin resistance N-acetyltransferase ArsN1 family B [Calothrix sp. UHCC 0171]|uniref:arsinothricin resistance N-acetyltransferase ArsN1 family B n=1 Tax=Calothrix sp. UHCC 0171 TaxID=3110245 RepID=UPI002B1FE55C|nr:arsinothricin resistance N-acetyltransferase ArsN1 family B [Calothrix sp. UHCC 0171]MEA5569711.1 arsinothricin resistance N-acetyltransferase ArsN1 family B [Calothrix sp. UHCC 0171]